MVTMASGEITAASTLLEAEVVWTAWNRPITIAARDIITNTGGTTSSAQTWIVWNRGLTATLPDTSVTTSTWGAWNTQYVLASIGSATTSAVTTIATDNVWVAWNRDARVTPASAVRPNDAEYRRQTEAWAKAQQEAAAERVRAKERALRLLREQLTDEQKAELAEKRYFSLSTIDSKSGEHRHYRIHQGSAGNVEQVDANGKKLKRFCIHPTIACPEEDTMLTQMLWLRTQEEEFLRVANHRA